MHRLTAFIPIPSGRSAAADTLCVLQVHQVVAEVTSEAELGVVEQYKAIASDLLQRAEV